MDPRSLLCTFLVIVAVACVDSDAPRPVRGIESPPPAGAPLLPLSALDEPVTGTRSLPPGEPDPTEADISDLARLARYVFREMRVAEEACPFVNPLHDPLAFAFHVEVIGGHMNQVHLAWAGVRAEEELQRLEEPPSELTAYIECLAPRLEAVRMDPAPAGGEYQPEYSYPGHPSAP